MALTRSDRKTSKALDATNERDLPSLVERLFDNITALLDQKLALLKIELKEDLDAYMRGAIVLVAGAVTALLGLALANVALAFAISTFFTNTDLSQPAKYALGFLLAGLVYMIGGTGIVLVVKRRLAARGIVPRRTVAELERDKEWIESGLGKE